MDSNYPSTLLQNAVEAISSLPGVGSRSALRLALHLLRQPRGNIHRFADAISALADDVHYCRECHMISDDELCTICADTHRDHNVICVVESVRDVMSIESTRQYHGVYHVLGGIISPINGIGPSDLTIRELTDRVSASLKNCPPPCDPASENQQDLEIILALSGDVEGETTSFYIYRQLEPYHVLVTTLARGLGFGDDLEYADSLTLGRSLLNRQTFKP